MTSGAQPSGNPASQGPGTPEGAGTAATSARRVTKTHRGFPSKGLGISLMMLACLASCSRDSAPPPSIRPNAPHPVQAPLLDNQAQERLGREPADAAESAIASPPTPAQVQAALVEIERYSNATGRPLPTGGDRVRLQDALDVLSRDQSFGAQIRQHWAVGILPTAWQPSSFESVPTEESDSLEIPLSFSRTPTGPQCCTGGFTCSIFEDPAHRGATVLYSMTVYRPYLDVAPILDPQNWKNIDKAFDQSRYLQNSNCPNTDPPDLTPAPVSQPTLERDGTFHEHFHSELSGGANSPFVMFENILDINAHHDATNLSYTMSYGLCPHPFGSIRAALPAANGQAWGKLTLDDGYATVMDANGQSGEPMESASYQACKTFAVTEEFRNEVEDRLGDVDHGLPLSLKVFALQASIAVCQGLTTSVPGANCSAPRFCPPAVPSPGKSYDQMCQD